MNQKAKVIKNLYDWGRISINGLRAAVEAKDITAEEFYIISGIEYK